MVGTIFKKIDLKKFYTVPYTRPLHSAVHCAKNTFQGQEQGEQFESLNDQKCVFE